MANYLKLFQIPDNFRFHRGGLIEGGILAYETWGKLSPDKNNAVLILTGLSADSHAASHSAHDTAGWWEYMIGPDKAIDTNQWFVICASSLGSCKGSTGPCSPNPATGQPYRFDFPDLTLEDIANSSKMLCESLGIDQLHATVGPSMGGMTALALLLNHKNYSRHLIHIASGMASPPFSTAIRSLQREAILKDENFNKGYYSAANWPEEGMKFARKIGMLSYRSAAEWRERFPRSLKQVPEHDFGIEFPVESYLEHHANQFIHKFDPISYLYLSRAMDWFNGDAYATKQSQNPLHGVNLQSALVIGAHTDLLFPVDLQQGLYQKLIDIDCSAQLSITDSIQGHDAFLVDQDVFSGLVGDYLNQTV
ncbi:homoserine O-acetyltransferase [Marinicella sp. S1101]|uniref:homoserine O-acetyltransferase MetX n=1 Tax=Marinicella marina TaxID=2996016 RepID=UPI002260BFB6|nr:homoserine O-acetyltransferase [Marinicella marina]MCX7552971.1 homoserine O-acetyltransferase [Marinicella marina]MDJ1139719.1 homoserine O-acetyltransferase [Marinicella marina]